MTTSHETMEITPSRFDAVRSDIESMDIIESYRPQVVTAA